MTGDEQVRQEAWRHGSHVALMPGAARVDTLSREESLRLLASQRVGRAVFTSTALPAVVPITFAVRGGAVMMATSAQSRLARAADRGVLAFEADDIDLDTRSGWSVIVIGVAELVTSRAAVDVLVSEVVKPWAPGADDLLIRLPCERVTGRRLTAYGDSVSSS